ncbi:unnamed protein product [marine sediment metagenome]|uniref:Uncharacterized protein n=1 Tax=marine sediment metagenome TaxID=412755 RepID=X1Q0T7_9ZZZZ
MKRLKMEMVDPIFAPGESRTAIATFAVKPAGLACTAELWLSSDGIAKDATTGETAFTSTGVDQSISLPVVMPAGGYAYRVFLDISIEGIPILAFEADEAVIIPWVGPPVITW